MILKLFIVLTAIMGSRPLYALTVISDLDDTVKITHVNSASAIYNGLFGQSVFLGMDKLIRAYKETDASTRIIFVSGSPKIIKRSIQELFKSHQIQADGVFLENGSKNKISRLHELIKNLQDEVVLLGDDQEHDPDFYQQLKHRYPDKIKAIYIHQLNNRIPYKGQRGFITAYELALFEEAAGRLNQKAVENVYSHMQRVLQSAEADPFMFERIAKTLVPKWSECIRHSNPFRLDLGLQSFLSYLERIYYQNCQW